jgi:hypothetical protein
MRRALGLAMLFAGLAGCSSSPTGPSTDSAGGVAPDFRATSFTVSQKVPLDLVFFINCANGGAGENVTFSGVLNELFHVTTNGNRFVLNQHFQPQGVKGVGETTGDVYNATGLSQETTISGTVGFTHSFVNNFKLIGPGPGNNLLVHENLQITVNANGTLTVFRDLLTVTCK